MSASLRLVSPTLPAWPQRARRAAGRFLAWWRDELLALLPSRLRAWVQCQPDELRLLIGAEQVELSLRTAAGLQALGTYDADADKPGTPLRAGIDQHLSERTRVILQLPPDQQLVCTLRFPLAARENLRQILGYEMDRHTPFTREQVYFDYVLLAADAGQLEVRLHVVAREVTERALRLARRLGLTPHVLGIAGAVAAPGQGSLNLLPAQLRPPRFSRRQRLDATLALLGLLLIAGNLAIPFWHQQRHLALLEQERAQARAAADGAFDLRARRDALLASLERIREHRQATPPTLRILDELSARLPDDTWLQRVEISSGGLQLQGESSAASALIQRLEDSPWIKDVSFRSPTTQDPATGQEHFQIAAHLGTGDRP